MYKEKLTTLIKNNVTFTELLKNSNIHKSDLLIMLGYLAKCENLNESEKKLISNMIYDNFFYNIYSEPNSIIILADLHLGDYDDHPEYLDYVYNYAVKNNIKDIYIVGDIIDSIENDFKIGINSYAKQYEYFLKNYPYDKNINNYALMGNHDYLMRKHGKIDLNINLAKDRKDFITIGYKKAFIKIFGNAISFKHPIDKFNLPIPLCTPDIQFRGHGHEYKYKQIVVPNRTDNIHAFKLSHLSNPHNKSLSNPGFIQMNFYYLEEGNLYDIQLYEIKDKKIKKEDTKELIIKRRYPV